MTEVSSEKNSVGENDRDETAVEIGKLFFAWRDYTPIPLIILLLIVARPNAASASAGLLLVVLGELVRIYSVAFIGSISRTRSESLGGALVRSGPFSYVRNPLYVGNFFISTGIAVYGGRAWLVILAIVAFAFQYYYVVKYEESLLRARFGDTYDQYCKDVPPWLPRRKVDFSNLEIPADLGPALRSERRTLTAIVAIIVVLMFLG